MYDPTTSEPFKLSRFKVQLFLECARCFYLDRRRGVSRPDGPPFSLNSTVDLLLKRELDACRAQGVPHPIMIQNGIEAVPFQHPELDTWRDALHGGLQWHHSSTNFLLTGAVDDLWQGSDGSLIVVDYKATSTEKTISIEHSWHGSYQRQAEFYQWLLRKNGFTVSSTAYFVYANAHRSRTAFDRSLTFDLLLLPYGGSDDWVEEALTDAKACLCEETPPPSARGCVWCEYRTEARTHEHH